MCSHSEPRRSPSSHAAGSSNPRHPSEKRSFTQEGRSAVANHERPRMTENGPAKLTKRVPSRRKWLKAFFAIDFGRRRRDQCASRVQRHGHHVDIRRCAVRRSSNRNSQSSYFAGAPRRDDGQKGCKRVEFIRPTRQKPTAHRASRRNGPNGHLRSGRRTAEAATKLPSRTLIVILRQSLTR
jgi:hypothetical protein